MNKSVNKLMLIIAFMLGSQSVEAGFILDRKVWIRPNEPVLKICNYTGDELRIAFIYKYVRGPITTYPAKGMFIFSPDECDTVATHSLFGLLSIVKNDVDSITNLKTYYSTGTEKAQDIQISFNEFKTFTTMNLCVGTAPLEEYRDDVNEYKKCSKGQQILPFNIMLNFGGNEHFTMELR